MLHGEAISFDADTWICTVHFDQEDNADPQHYMWKMSSRKSFPSQLLALEALHLYLTLACQSLRTEDRVKLMPRLCMYSIKWANDGLVSTFCVPYNHIRPMNDDNELKDDLLAKDGDLKKSNTGLMFASYVGCAVFFVCRTISHPAKLPQIFTNWLKFVIVSVSWVPDTRMIPVLDNDIPGANQKKHNQFCYIPTCDNLQ